METFFALLALCAGNSPATGEFPALSPVTRNFDVFYNLRLNKRLSKQSWGWWLATPLDPLWRHCNEIRQSKTIHTCCEIYYRGMWYVTQVSKYNQRISNLVLDIRVNFLGKPGDIFFIFFLQNEQYPPRLYIVKIVEGQWMFCITGYKIMKYAPKHQNAIGRRLNCFCRHCWKTCLKSRWKFYNNFMMSCSHYFTHIGLKHVFGIFSLSTLLHLDIC